MLSTGLLEANGGSDAANDPTVKPEVEITPQDCGKFKAGMYDLETVMGEKGD